jgi:hypothetical protein
MNSSDLTPKQVINWNGAHAAAVICLKAPKKRDECFQQLYVQWNEVMKSEPADFRLSVTNMLHEGHIIGVKKDAIDKESELLDKWSTTLLFGKRD